MFAAWPIVVWTRSRGLLLTAHTESCLRICFRFCICPEHKWRHIHVFRQFIMLKYQLKTKGKSQSGYSYWPTHFPYDTACARFLCFDNFSGECQRIYNNDINESVAHDIWQRSNENSIYCFRCMSVIITYRVFNDRRQARKQRTHRAARQVKL